MIDGDTISWGASGLKLYTENNVSEINFGDAVVFRPYDFDDRYNTYIRYVLNFCKIDGLWLEFGVGSGATTEKYIKFMKESGVKKPFYGFDSFLGLPENWATHPVGAFSTGGRIPDLPGLEVVVGMFADTLPSFLLHPIARKEPVSVLIVDCDLYSSTKTIFDNLKNQIVEGTVIIFDELYNYPSWENHEYKAFMEFIKEKDVSFRWLAYCGNTCQQAACIVEKIGKRGNM